MTGTQYGSFALCINLEQDKADLYIERVHALR